MVVQEARRWLADVGLEVDFIYDIYVDAVAGCEILHQAG